MKRKFFFLFACLGLVYLSLAIYQLWLINLPLVSPLDLIETVSPLAPIFRKPGLKTVFGFLPYWNMKYANQLTVKPLTHLAYFGIDLNNDGSVKTHDNPKEKEPGWQKLNSPDFLILSRQVKLLRKKLILVVRAMDDDQIKTIINSDENRQTAIQTIVDITTERGFDGVNIDFEYIGHPDTVTRANFTKFISDVSSRCKKISVSCELSVDILADSGIKNRLYDLKAIGKIADQIIVMAYDFYRPSSVQAGPVAPLRGKCSSTNYPSPKLGEGGTVITGGEASNIQCLDYDVTTSISDISKLIPPSKIILGIPFYGYEWQTVDDQYLSRTYPKTGAMATYKRIQDLFSDTSVSSFSAQWSGLSFSPYLSYVEDHKTYQVYYEDINSLTMKIELVHQAKLAGISIWALGYEIPYPNLWQTIENSL